jgi:hypothetical protein
LVLSLNLLVNVLLLPLYNYRKRLERLIENWRRYKPESALTLIADKVAIVGLGALTTLIFVAILVIVPFFVIL